MVGLGTVTFSNALKAIDEIYDIFSWVLPEGSLEPADSITCGGNDILHASNRLLMPKKDSKNMQVLQPANGVNMCGVLKAIINEGEYLYCDDNEVKYFKYKTDEKER